VDDFDSDIGREKGTRWVGPVRLGTKAIVYCIQFNSNPALQQQGNIAIGNGAGRSGGAYFHAPAERDAAVQTAENGFRRLLNPIREKPRGQGNRQ
jgi:hypothetical protein